MRKLRSRGPGTVMMSLAAAMLAWSGACSGPDYSSSPSGRIDPYRTTEADRHSDRANIPAMLEFTDVTADRLADEITSLRRIEAAEHRLLLELGTIDNQSYTPTSDFEQIQRRLRSRLLQSDLIRDRFLVVEDRARIDRELDRVGASEREDLLQEQPADAGGSARYEPEHTYVLQGDFYESRRGNRRQYYFNFRLVHLGTRAIVFDSDFDLGQH